MPVRKVVTRSGGHARGYMPSLKNGSHIAWESQLELQFYRLLELSPMVRGFDVQPTREPVIVDGVPGFYIPDVRVHFNNGATHFFEVKPEAKCKTKRIADRLAAIKRRFDETDRSFHLVTDRWLMVEPRASNIRRLMYHRRPTLLSISTRLQLCRQISANQPSTIAELTGLLGAANAWLLLGMGIVGVDLEKPLNDESQIYLEGGHCHAHFHA